VRQLCSNRQKRALVSGKREISPFGLSVHVAGIPLKDAQKRIDIAVSDHRMPGMTGVEFFEQLFQKHRNVLRVMLSGVGALPAPPPQKPDAPPPPALDWATKSKLNQAKAQVKNAAYNEGQVHRFIEKPWNDEELKTVVADMAAIVKSTRRRPSA
jgi:CheY-like chemotaxis protein